MTDEQLMRRIASGDEEALVELHHRYVNLVYSMAYRVLGNGPAAEEATQDVFMKLWERADQFDPSKGRLTSWLLTVARRTAIDLYRKQARRTPDEGLWSLDDAEWLAVENASFTRRAADEHDSLRHALADLPDEQRDVLLLAYFGGLSQSEIARHLDIPLGTVKTRMRLGMNKLRDALLLADEEPREI